MSEKRKYVSVILPLKLEWEPCYYLPAGIGADVAVGTRVMVRFAGKSYVGAVSATGIVPEVEDRKIMPILSVVEGLPPVSRGELELWRFVAEYYLCTIGEVYKAAYPSLKIGMEMSRARQEERRKSLIDKKIAALQSKKERILASVRRYADLADKAKREDTRAKYLDSRQRFLSQSEELEREIAGLENTRAARDTPLSGSGLPDNAGFALSGPQKEALEKIKESFAAGKPVLLHGVTGSGKTEIYETLALETLKQGRNVLYMVPEIAVSRQLEERLRKVFGRLLYAFHSKETAARRQEIASEIRSGNYIVLGTRSALFLPHHDLGLIVVDEEHDTSYKQDAPAPRYNGRDTALMLARIMGAEVLLGTATPSLESLYNCRSGRMDKVDLNCRYFGSADADVEIVDTRAERRKHGMSGNFSFKLIAHINDALAQGGQVLILRGRRAYSPAVQCSACGDIPRCPHCNVPLSWHRQEGILLCHYCGWREPYTGKCRKCGGDLEPLGSGTQRIEEEASALFPDARVARLDGDTAMEAGREAEIIRDFAKKNIDILIGTQILAKGFDFDGLSLVAVIHADSLLGQQDFRADERAVQLLEQFRGRSGRRGDKGLLVIQTSQPDHPVYNVFKSSDEAPDTKVGLVDSMMGERYSFGYPPFSRIVNVILKDASEARVEEMSRELALAIRSAFGISVAGFVQNATMPVSVLGPYPPTVDRQAGLYIRIVRVSLRKDKALSANKKKLAEVVRRFDSENAANGRIALDVDPA